MSGTVPFFMEGEGFILHGDDFKKYNGHKEIHKYTITAKATTPPVPERVPASFCAESIKEWLKPTKISKEDIERWKETPVLRVLMIKTKNEFSGDPEHNIPTRRTIPGCTEVIPHEDQKQHIKFISDVFQHAQLPLSAVGAYLKSHLTFLSAPTYESFNKDGGSTGLVTKYYCSGSSWSISWSYFHTTRHTAAVLLYREGDGLDRRLELEQELFRLRRHISHPMLLAFAKTQISIAWTFNMLEKVNAGTFDIEKSLGVAVWDWILDREIPAYQDPKLAGEDLEEKVAQAQKWAVERYNVLRGQAINVKFRLRSFREQIQWLRRMNHVYLKSLHKHDTDFVGRRQECSELDMVLDRLNDFSKVYIHDAETLDERICQQMSSMSYLVSQRDSRIGLIVADINNELAWQGKRLNHAMMAIAVASFIFLPATFIASVFDAPIFNFDLGSNTIVTEPFWIFWLACGLTTALLCLCWTIWIRKKNADDKERRSEARKAFRKKLLRVPTLTKRVNRAESVDEPNKGLDHAWLWSRRLKSGIDEEQGIGLGAVKARSFQKAL